MKKSVPVPILAAIAIATPGGASTNVADQLVGQWGGPHIKLLVTRDSGRMSFECGNGAFTLPSTIERSGAFSATGRLERYGGGPSSAGSPNDSIAVSVRGRVTGDHLRLTVLDEGGTRTRYDLIRNDRWKLIRCL